MEKFNKNDEVKIHDKNKVWNNLIGIVIDDPEDSLEDTDSLDDSEVKVKLTLENNENKKIVIQYFPRYKLQKIVKESADREFDYIKKYVDLKDLDDNIINSWIFTSKISLAENKEEKQVLKDAKKFKYKIFKLTNGKNTKFIVASKNCTLDSILDDYVNYLSSDYEIKEI